MPESRRGYVKIRTVLFSAVVLGLASSAAFAQMVPYGLMPPYRVMALVRQTGLIPVSSPMLSGATYVVRAIDRSGTPVRVVVDGRYGEIIAVRRAAMQPPAYGYPRRYDPYGVESAPPPGYRAYPPSAARPDAYPPAARPDAYPRSAARPDSYPQDSAVPGPPSGSVAITPARPTRPPVPRARPSEAPASAAVVRPAEAGDTTAAIPATPPPTAAPAARPKAQPEPGGSFPPVQSLE
jgi:hypothetical protein